MSVTPHLTSLAAVLALVVLEACGAAPRRVPAPPPAAPSHEPEIVAPPDLSPNVRRDRRADPGVRAEARALVIGKRSSVKCGAITKAPSDAPLSDLLGGRLRVRTPAGATIPQRSAGGPELLEESRIVVEPGSKEENERASLAIVARELFQLDTDLYEAEGDAPTRPASLDVEARKFLRATFPSPQRLEVVPVEIGSGPAKLRAYAARPPQPNAPPGQDTALVLALLLVQDDGALESIGFYVRGEMVRSATGSDLVGCTRLAERIASTIVPGPLRLERAAGRRKIADVPPGRELAVTVPADYVAIPTSSGARLYKLRPLSLYAGSISIAVVDGGAPDAPEPTDATTPGTLLGRPIEWRGKATPKGGFSFVAEPLEPRAGSDGGKSVEVLVKATREAKMLEEMRGVAETLTIDTRAR